MKKISIEEQEKKLKNTEQKLAEQKKILKFKKQIEAQEKEINELKNCKEKAEKYDNYASHYGVLIKYITKDIYTELKQNNYKAFYNQLKMIELLKNNFNFFSELQQQQA